MILELSIFFRANGIGRWWWKFSDGIGREKVEAKIGAAQAAVKGKDFEIVGSNKAKPSNWGERGAGVGTQIAKQISSIGIAKGSHNQMHSERSKG